MTGKPELGDGADRADNRGSAAHVGFLANDVRLGLQEVAARVERDRLADEAELCLAAPHTKHDQASAVGAPLSDGGQSREAALLDLIP